MTQQLLTVGPVVFKIPLVKAQLILTQYKSAFPFLTLMAKTSTGSNARFRQESTMEKASQWFVFPSDTEGGGGGGSCFLAVVTREGCSSFALFPQRWVCLSAFF